MVESDAAHWDAMYEGRPMPTARPSAALRRFAAWIPTEGRVLDVAGGDGAQAVWMAKQGHDVTLCDVSPKALERAEQLAEQEGVSLATVRVDLEQGPFPPGPWDLVHCSSYLQRSLWAAAAPELAAGGHVMWLHPTLMNYTRHAKPSMRFLLDPGEGRALVEDAGLEILVADEGWIAGRHLSCVIARRVG